MLAPQLGYSQCTFTYSSVINATCFGDCNGSATVIPTGGTPPYTYIWSTSPPQFTQTAINLCAGNYQCSVSDVTGPCVAQNNPPVITEPPALTLTISPPAPSFCADTCLGLYAIVSGGTPPYSYLWSNGVTTASTTVCSGGVYTVIIQDANGCTVSSSIAVNANPVPVYGAAVYNASCDTCCDGYFIHLLIGGTPPYNLSCTTSSNLCPGTYYCCLIDALGCTDCDSIVISYPSSVLENISNAGIKIYPNPFNSSATIIFNSELKIQNAELKMYDVTGREVKQFTITNGQSEIQRGNLQSGIYFYKMTSDSGMIAAGKIMVD